MTTPEKLKPLTNEERAANKDRRIHRNAADPNDGLTVRLLFGQPVGQVGDVVVLRKSLAQELIKAGKAELAE